MCIETKPTRQNSVKKSTKSKVRKHIKDNLETYKDTLENAKPVKMVCYADIEIVEEVIEEFFPKNEKKIQYIGGSHEGIYLPARCVQIDIFPTKEDIELMNELRKNYVKDNGLRISEETI